MIGKLTFTSHDLTYFACVRRISPSQREVIEAVFKAFEGHELTLKKSFEAFDLGRNFADWDSAAYQALYCFKKDLISVECLANVLITRIAYQREFVDQDVTDARNSDPKLIEQDLREMTTYYLDEDLKKEIDSSKRMMTEDEMREYRIELERLSPRAQTLLYSLHLSDNIDHSLRIGQGLNIFQRVGRYRVFPSFQMMQLFLDIVCRKNAVTLNPVIGLSTDHDISVNNFSSSRDLSLPFPSVVLPKMADGFIALGWSFSYHDFYHAYIQSQLDKKMRLGANWIADIIKTAPAKGISVKFREAFQGQIRDMDFALNQKNGIYARIPRTDLFWYEFVFAWERAYNELTHDLDSIEKLPFEQAQVNERLKLYTYLIKTLLKLRQEWNWEEEFGLSIKGLSHLCEVHREATRASEAIQLANKGEGTFEECYEKTIPTYSKIPEEVFVLQDLFSKLNGGLL